MKIMGTSAEDATSKIPGNRAQRDRTLDIVKGLAIVLLVLVHSSSSSGHAWTKFLLLFGVSVFFIASGLCFKSENLSDRNTALTWLKKRLLRLWLPGAFWIALFCMIHMALVRLSLSSKESFDALRFGHDIIAAAFLMPYDFTCVPLWFLHALFWCSLYWWKAAAHAIAATAVSQKAIP